MLLFLVPALCDGFCCVGFAKNLACDSCYSCSLTAFFDGYARLSLFEFLLAIMPCH